MSRKAVRRLVEEDRPGAIWEPVEDHGELDAEVREHLLRGRAVALVSDPVAVRRRQLAALLVLLLPVVVVLLGLATDAGLLAPVIAALLLLPCLAGGGVLALPTLRARSELPRPVEVRPVELAAPEEELHRRAADTLHRVLTTSAEVEEQLRDTLPEVRRATEELAPRLVRSSRLRLAVDSLTPSATRDDLVADLAVAHRQSTDVVDALTSYAGHVDELAVEVRALRDQERAVELRGQLDDLTASGAGEEHTASWLRRDGDGLSLTSAALAQVRRRLYADVRRLSR